MTKVAFLGLGAMGSRMAAHLLRAGCELTVWNRTAARTEPLVEQGARAAATPRQAADGADFVISMVRDDDASRQVWFDPGHGAAQALAEKAIAMESSTVSIGWSREFGRRLAAEGRQALDAPVLGSRPQAEAKQLIFVVGGPHPVFHAAEPLMREMGGAAQWAGEAGSGATVKLAVNTLMGVQVAAFAELIALLARNDVDPEVGVEIICASPTASPMIKAAAGLMLGGDHAPRFPVELIEKDLGYSLEAAGAEDAAPMAAAARAVFRRAIAAGSGDSNMTAVARLYGEG